MMQSSLEGKGHDFPDKSCRLILIGKTGNGKSATGNTILGKDLFQSKSGINSETKKGAFYTATRNNLIIEVMDTPGLDDTDGQDDILREEIKKSLFSMQPGPHALLLVLRCDRRFNKQDLEVYNALKKIFGEHLPSYMIVVIVGVDNEPSRIGHFEAQISRNKYIQQILNEANSRYVFVRNNASHAEKQEDVTKLIGEVRKLVIENNNRYFQHLFSMEIESPLNLMTNEEINLIGLQRTSTSGNNTKSEPEPTGNSDSDRISSETDSPERSRPVECDSWNTVSNGGNTVDEANTKPDDLSITSVGLLTGHDDLSITSIGLLTGHDDLNTAPDGLITEHDDLNTIPDGLIAGHDNLNITPDGLITGLDGLNTTPDGLIAGHDNLNTTPDILITEHDSLNTTLNTLITGHDGLNTTLDALITGHDGLNTTDGMMTERAGLSTNREEMKASPDGLSRTPLDISSELDCVNAVTHEKKFLRPEEKEETVPCTVQGLVNFFNSPRERRRMRGPNPIAKVEPYNHQCKYPKYAEQRRHQESTMRDDSKATNQNVAPSNSSTVFDRETTKTSKRTNANQIDNATQTDHHSKETQGQPYERLSDDDLRYLAEISVKVKIVNAPSELTKTQIEQFQKSVPNLGKKLTDGFAESHVKKVECSLM